MACAAAAGSGVPVDSDEATAGPDRVHDRGKQRAGAAADIGHRRAGRDARRLPEVLLALPGSVGHEPVAPQFVLAKREGVARGPSRGDHARRRSRPHQTILNVAGMSAGSDELDGDRVVEPGDGRATCSGHGAGPIAGLAVRPIVRLAASSARVGPVLDPEAGLVERRHLQVPILRHRLVQQQWVECDAC